MTNLNAKENSCSEKFPAYFQRLKKKCVTIAENSDQRRLKLAFCRHKLSN